MSFYRNFLNHSIEYNKFRKTVVYHIKQTSFVAQHMTKANHHVTTRGIETRECVKFYRTLGARLTALRQDLTKLIRQWWRRTNRIVKHQESLRFSPNYQLWRDHTTQAEQQSFAITESGETLLVHCAHSLLAHPGYYSHQPRVSVRPWGSLVWHNINRTGLNSPPTIRVCWLARNLSNQVLQPCSYNGWGLRKE